MNLYQIFFISIFWITSLYSIAQNNENEVVLASEKFTIQNIQEIKQLLQTKEGLIYKGFCEEHKVILFQINNNSYNIKNIIELINTIIPENSIYIKEGGFDSVYKICDDKEKLELR